MPQAVVSLRYPSPKGASIQVEGGQEVPRAELDAIAIGVRDAAQAAGLTAKVTNQFPHGLVQIVDVITSLPLDDLPARAAELHDFVGRLHALDTAVRGIHILDALLDGFRYNHPFVASVDGPTDEPRHKRLSELRAITLAPWLDGRFPVRDIDAFREWYAGLSADESRLLDLVFRYRGFALRPACACCPGARDALHAAADALVARGWLVYDQAGTNGYRYGKAGPAFRRLNRTAGEILPL